MSARARRRGETIALTALLCWGQGCKSSTPAPTATTSSAATGKATAVLFVGNSLTFANDLPRKFSALARSMGDTVDVDVDANGGETLLQHLSDPATRQKIAARPWDFVVLQEQSNRPAFATEWVEQNVAQPALKLDELIHAQHPATKTAYYETWGHRNGDTANCGVEPEICSYDGMQRRINITYASLSAKTSGVLVPVGEAWAAVRRSHPEIELYSGDYHPSLAGTYLAACVFYASLFTRSPIGADALGIDPAQAKILQEAADAAVLGATAAR